MAGQKGGAKKLPAAVKDYLAAVPANRLKKVQALHELVLSLSPDITVDLQYKMPTYHLGDGWVAIANQKSYVSLYTCTASHIAGFKKKHPQQKTGGACINFRQKDELPLEDLREVVALALAPKA